MLLINIIGIIIILLNIAGLFYLLLIAFRNMTGNFKQDLSKIKIQPELRNNRNKIRKETLNQNNIIPKKDDLLDDLDLSDFDDLNLDDFD